jgi:uncharacterized membrane protein YhaH (DUF805 family)|tara:strand:- start:1083 stop:1427 length:345 start_codon:yes stop_codon:yes gene_type:complete
MTFLKSVETCFYKYIEFNGRASRSEFWWFYLFVIICWIIGFVLGPIIEAIIILGLLIPYIAVQARRLHDIGKSGWLQLISLIPLIGAIILIVWSATEGTKKKNKYGAPIKLKKS